MYRNVLASYMHLHADGSPGWAEGIVAKARAYAREARGCVGQVVDGAEE